MTKKIKRLLKNRIKTLRKEQKAAFDEMQKDPFLQLCYSCGFGKNYLMGTDLFNQLVTKEDKYFAILSHRLGLNDQHVSDIFDLFLPILGEVVFAFIGSDGGLDLENLTQKHRLLVNKRLYEYNLNLPANQRLAYNNLTITTTDKHELEQFIRSHQNKKIIFVSTYHSSHLLGNIPIDLGTIYCDEAHELASNFNDANKKESFINFFLNIRSKRKFFFTATPKDCSEDPSSSYLMNNQKIFGRRIGMSHRESVEKGYILPINLAIVSPLHFDPNFNNDFDSDANKAFFLWKCLFYNWDWLKITSHYPNKIAPKLLIRCSSVEEHMWPIFNELIKIVQASNLDIKVFASAAKDDTNSTSNNNIIWQNGEKLQFDKKSKKFSKKESYVDRKQYIQAIQSLDDYEPAIILHHDTISEGINVPGITCVIPFSDTLPSFAKLYQNIGRGIRLNSIDKKLFFEGKIKLDSPGWIKPETQVIIPYWNVISYAAKNTMVETIINLEQNFYAKTSIEIPNGTEHALGKGEIEMTTCQQKITNSKLNLNDLTFEQVYSRAQENKKRREMSSLTENMTILERLNFLNENY